MTFQRIAPKDINVGDCLFYQQGNQTRFQGRVLARTGELAVRIIDEYSREFNKFLLSDSYMVSSDITDAELSRKGDYGQLLDEHGNEVEYI